MNKKEIRKKMKEITELSKSLKIEIATALCQKDGKTFWTDYVFGDISKVPLPKCPKDSECLLVLHSHIGRSEDISDLTLQDFIVLSLANCQYGCTCNVEGLCRCINTKPSEQDSKRLDENLVEVLEFLTDLSTTNDTILRLKRFVDERFLSGRMNVETYLKNLRKIYEFMKKSARELREKSKIVKETYTDTLHGCRLIIEPNEFLTLIDARIKCKAPFIETRV